MTADDKLAPICRQVWDRAVEGRDVMRRSDAASPTSGRA